VFSTRNVGFSFQNFVFSNQPTETSGVNSGIFGYRNFRIAKKQEVSNKVSVERKPEKFSKFQAKRRKGEGALLILLVKNQFLISSVSIHSNFFGQNTFRNGQTRAFEFPPRFWSNIVQVGRNSTHDWFFVPIWVKIGQFRKISANLDDIPPNRWWKFNYARSTVFKRIWAKKITVLNWLICGRRNSSVEDDIHLLQLLFIHGRRLWLIIIPYSTISPNRGPRAGALSTPPKIHPSHGPCHHGFPPLLNTYRLTGLKISYCR
jgi:hypothetical protein